MGAKSLKLPKYDDELTTELILLRHRDDNDTVYQMLELFYNGYRHYKKTHQTKCWDCINKIKRRHK